MKKQLMALAASLACLLAGLQMSPAAAELGGGPVAPSGAADPLQLVNASLTKDEFAAMTAAGYDITDAAPAGGRVEVEMVVNGPQLAELRQSGVTMEVVARNGAGAGSRALAEAAATTGSVWKPWSGPGGLGETMRQLAAAHPDIAKLVPYGTSVNGQELLAIKVTKGAARSRDGSRPGVMYLSLQHAREWIVGEVNLRLLTRVLTSYGTDPGITQLVDSNELWFILAANPDGYDYTFTNDRLWRKNLADNDGDGVITGLDGVDPNRNFAFKWGYDNEGSSDDPGDATYRGPAPSSEPETQALDSLVRRVKPEFFVNYHSAAELLLYGNGWQVATPEPDDHIAAALLGDDQQPAVAGYDPDISAELYTTNGETTNHLGARYGVLAYTPELDTCEAAEAIFPDDAFGPGYCAGNGLSVFEFPDDEALVQAVYEKNLPLALDVARSAADPANPVSSQGRTAPDFVLDPFETSYGSPQPVAVEMKRGLRDGKVHYSINGGAERTAGLERWRGGERYGDNGTAYYGEYRGVIRQGRPGDQITVWFSAGKGRTRVTSPRFTYTLASDTGHDVLVLANEDYLGFNPPQPGVTAPRYAAVYADAIRAAGERSDSWDVSAQGVPHHLGVLGHYDHVVWETGDNKLPQEAEDVLTDTPFGPLPDLQVAESQQYLLINVRDYLNEGGKVIQAGEWVGYFGTFGGPLGGAYYGLNGDPTADCVVTTDFFADCLIYSDDFAQYYQGLWTRSEAGLVSGATGVGSGLSGTYNINGAEVPEAGSFLVTSDVLPADGFPQFRSAKSMEYTLTGPDPFAPFSGDYYVAAQHNDESYMRLTSVIDLTGATSAELAFKLSYDVETGYDHVIVEARTAGGTNYTTLPDLNGGTSQVVPTECEAGFLLGVHPFLASYLTPGAPCTPTGTSGAWNSFTGSSAGWTDARFDLSAYAGSQVEVSITYVTDPSSGGLGVFVDDTVITVGTTATTTDFEADQGPWTVPGPPAGSPPNGADWIRSLALFPTQAAAVSTRDTVTFGFGLEAVATAEERARLMRQALRHLGN